MKNLIIRPEVIMTSVVNTVLLKLDTEFIKAGFKASITSVKRDENKQLSLIENEAKKRKIIANNIKLDLTTQEMFNGEMVYTWQLIWSKLLNQGFIINPPNSARVLLDYFKDGINKKGLNIQPSPHFFGKSFDIGGFNNVYTVEKCYNLLLGIKGIVGIRNVLLERVNNCVHCDCV